MRMNLKHHIVSDHNRLHALDSTSDHTDLNAESLLAIPDITKRTALTNINAACVWDNTSGWWKKCRHTSWWQEVGAPPMVAYPVAHSAGVTIYDMKDMSAYLAWTQDTDYALGVDSNNNPSSIAAQGRYLVVGQNGSAATGLYIIDMLTERVLKFDASGYYQFLGDIAARDTAAGYQTISTSTKIVNVTVNAVDIAEVDGYIYIAAGTDGGVSIIRLLPDGRVDTSYGTSGVADSNLTDAVVAACFGKDFLAYAENTSAECVHVVDDIANLSDGFTADTGYTAAAAPAILDGSIYDVERHGDILWVATANGISTLKQLRGDETNGAEQSTTITHITPPAKGDIRGTYVPALTDTSYTQDSEGAIADRSASGMDLTAKGGNVSVANFGDGAAKAFSFDGTNYLEQETFDSEQGALSYQGNDTTTAEFRDEGQDFSDWETTSGNAAYMLVVTNGDATVSWGYMGAANNGAGTNDDIDMYQDITRSTRGWNGTAPVAGGKTPSSYVVRDTKAQITGALTVAAWVKNPDVSDVAVAKWGAASDYSYLIYFVEDTPETHILSLAVFGGYLYAGTGSGGKIYRSSDGTAWAEVEDTTETYIYSLAVFDGYLYAGTSPGGKIYRSSDGTTWAEVEDTTETSIYSLAVFDGYLYAGTYPNGKIYRSSDGTTWTEVEDTTETHILSLTVFDGYLYAGTATGGKIYRSSDGTTWAEVEDTTETYIFSLAVFDGYLYAGTATGGKIYRSSDGTTWTEVEDTAESYIDSLAVFDGYLYAGTGTNGKIYRSSDGTTWSEVEDTTEILIQALAVFDGYLYAGTYPNGKIYRSSDGITWSEDVSGYASFVVYNSASKAATGSVDMSDDNWHQLVGVFVPSTSVTLYVDGVRASQNTSSIPATLNDISQPLVIGARSTGVDSHWNGEIALPLVTAEALTAAEIKELYDFGYAQLNAPASSSALPGSSNQVNALAFDEETEILWAGTEDGAVGLQTQDGWVVGAVDIDGNGTAWEYGDSRTDDAGATLFQDTASDFNAIAAAKGTVLFGTEAEAVLDTLDGKTVMQAALEGVAVDDEPQEAIIAEWSVTGNLATGNQQGGRVSLKGRFDPSKLVVTVTTTGDTSGDTSIDLNADGSSILYATVDVAYNDSDGVTATTEFDLSGYPFGLPDGTLLDIDIDSIPGGTTATGLRVLLYGTPREDE